MDFSRLATLELRRVVSKLVPSGSILKYFSSWDMRWVDCRLKVSISFDIVVNLSSITLKISEVCWSWLLW